MDPLSDVLSLLRLRTYTSFAFDAGGAWSFGYGPHDGIKFYAVVTGECWLSVDGVEPPVRARSGDCVLLPRGRGFRVASDLRLPPVDGLTGVGAVKVDGITRIQGGGGFFGVGGYFELLGETARVVLGMLPPIVHLREEADRAVLRWCAERMTHELRAPQPGGPLIAQQLATMLLVHALRLHLADGQGGVGWLFALADKPVAAALAAIHDDPARRWTLRSLGACAGMSRTSFALRFKQAVGVSAIEYVTQWRMRVASERLVTSRDPISVLARSLGYESESAFSTAFKRVMGCSPRQYSRERSPGSAMTS